MTLRAQCAGIASTPGAAADCAAHAIPMDTVAKLDPAHPYTLAELIDIAEHNNPRTRIVWERAKQKADELGIAKSAYYPVLAGVAAFSDQRIIDPFPKPLAPRGYVMAEIPAVVPEVTLDYLIFDFGKRGAKVDAATAEKLAAGANFVQANQQVAFAVASAYYKLLTQQERLEAAQQTLKTAQTTQDAAEAQLLNGRSTLPDVLNARAMADRPDLLAQIAEIRAADDAIRSAKSEYYPKIVLSANAAQTSIWPTADFGELGNASQATWSAALAVEWRLFDGGARKNELAAAKSQKRAAQDELREKRDQTTREVWTAYISFRTALRKQQAAVALLDSANASYSASLEAYKFGVKNLIDVVTAERQLAQARYSGVSARSQLFLEAVGLEFSTGNLLRPQPPATKTSTPQP
jgi:outer membrane protein TolC